MNVTLPDERPLVAQRIINRLCYKIIQVKDKHYLFDYVGTIEKDNFADVQQWEWCFGYDGAGFFVLEYIPTKERWATQGIFKESEVSQLESYISRVISEERSHTWHMNKYQAAEKIPASEWKEPIYLDGIGGEFFDSWDEALEYWEDVRHDDDPVIPSDYAWATKRIYVDGYTIENLLENCFDEMDEEAYDRMCAQKELVNEINGQLEAFFEQLKQHVYSYKPDYSKVILAPLDEIKL